MHGGALAMEARAGGAGEKSKRRRRRAQAAQNGAGAHGRRWASARVSGGGLERRRCVQASGGERWRRGGERVGRRRLGVRKKANRGRSARARDIYDRWARDFLQHRLIRRVGFERRLIASV